MPLRAPLAVLNELSLPPNAEPLPDDQASDALRGFVDVARALRKIRPDLALASAAPLGAIPVTEQGLGFAAFCEIRGGVDRERWRYVQGLRNIAPFASSQELQVPGLHEEYLHHDSPCEGLGVAATTGQLAVSFLTEDSWNLDGLEVTRRRLVEDEQSGDLAEEEMGVHVRHASVIAHVGVHAKHVADLALPDPFSGPDLWDDRTVRYPHLEFLPHVEGQLASLGHGTPAVKEVHDRLGELSDAAGSWDPAAQAFPAWKSHVTPEGEQRKQLCLFTDLDGATRCFDLHARFTPGAGRIHFRLVPESRRLRIAHVGLKLGS